MSALGRAVAAVARLAGLLYCRLLPKLLRRRDFLASANKHPQHTRGL
jgi:hypothetical protein